MSECDLSFESTEGTTKVAGRNLFATSWQQLTVVGAVSRPASFRRREVRYLAPRHLLLGMDTENPAPYGLGS